MSAYLTYLFFLTFCLIFFNKYLTYKKFLISETGDEHQKFASKINTPLTGGILIFMSLIYLLDKLEIFFLLFSFMIFVLGILSDMKFFRSAKLKLFLQILIIIFFVILSETQIIDTRVYLLDKLLTNTYFNYVFVIFCILIVVNGSNFFDGLNTLSIGYYLLISALLFNLNFNQEIYIDNFLLINLIFVLTITFILNLLNKVFLGDSGSYLLGFIFAIFLINIYKQNTHISPFFIILLLWYPSFELLFSIIRKGTLRRSALEPDSNHLHQLFYYYLKKKNSLKIFPANLISANLINAYNLIIFLISLNNITNTQIQLILILLNLMTYTVIYLRLFIYRYKRI